MRVDTFFWKQCDTVIYDLSLNLSVAFWHVRRIYLARVVKLYFQ